jgi:hypothetical protein
MAAVTDVTRPDYLFVGSEPDVIWAMLRGTILWKCEGLDEDHRRRRKVAPSTLSLLRHRGHADLLRESIDGAVGD